MLVSLLYQLDRSFKAIVSIFTLHCRQQWRHFHNSSCKAVHSNYYLLCLLFRALPVKWWKIKRIYTIVILLSSLLLNCFSSLCQCVSNCANIQVFMCLTKKNIKKKKHQLFRCQLETLWSADIFLLFTSKGPSHFFCFSDNLPLSPVPCVPTADSPSALLAPRGSPVTQQIHLYSVSQAWLR